MERKIKRFGDLYKDISSRDNIEEALRNSSVGKMNYAEVKEVFKDKDFHIEKIVRMLEEGSYECSEYVRFIKENKGKKRVISKLPFFPDRVIQHAILQVVEPIWKASLITHTFQSIKGRGVHSCLKEVRKAVQHDRVLFCLQIDVEQFYPSIVGRVLKEVLRRKIKCKDTLRLLDIIVDGDEGIPIGNYISQYFGNLFLSKLDHYTKEVLGIKHYYRYCDDLIVLSDSKDELKEVLRFVELHLEEIELTIKSNFQIYPISSKRGVDCLGYVVFPNKVEIRASIAREFSNKVRIMRRRRKVDMGVISSYYGWFKHCDSLALWCKITNPLLEVAKGENREALLVLSRKLKLNTRRRNVYY